MSKYGDDIRRISKYQELLDLIRQNKNSVNQTTKAAVDGARGVAYGGNGVSTSKGTPGDTSPDNNDVTDKRDTRQDVKRDGESKVGDDDINHVGDSDISSLDNTNRDGWYDIDSAVQAAKDALGKYPPTEGNPQKIDALTGLLTPGGRKIVAIFKEAGLGMLGPDDRDSANEKVTDPGYTPGFYFRANNGGGSTVQDIRTAAEAVQSGKEYLDSALPSPRPPVTFLDWYDSTNTSPAPPPSIVNTSGFMRYEDTLSNVSSLTATYLACSTASDLFSCPVVGPAVLWADLGATQIAWCTLISAIYPPFNAEMNGKFVTHPYDDNIPSEYINGASILNLETSLSNTVQIGPLGGGGWYAGYTDSLGGAFSGNANDASILKINANRTHGGFISPNQLNRLLPPNT